MDTGSSQDKKSSTQQQFSMHHRNSYSLGSKGAFPSIETNNESSKQLQKKSIYQDMNPRQSHVQQESAVEKQPSEEKFQKAFKVHFIYEKLQDRLKLRKKDNDQNFRKMMQEFKQLDTFVDTRQEIQNMNLAFQKGFKSSLEVLKIRDRIQQLNKELKDTSTKYQMQFGEYEVIEDQQEGNNLQSIKGIKQARELLRRSKRFLQTKSKNFKSLDNTQAITDTLKGYIQKHTQTVNQIELKDDINEFYTNLEYVFEQQKKLISLKEQHDELERKKQEEKEKQLRELIKQSKFEMNNENEKNVPNQGYFDEYHKRTEKAINKAIKESKRIYREKLGLISQKEKLFLDIQENIIDKNLDKPQIDLNEQNSSNHHSNTGQEKSIFATQIKPINKLKSAFHLLTKSNASSPQKQNLATQAPSSVQHQTKILINPPSNNNIQQKFNSSLSKFNQSSGNNTNGQSEELQEEQQQSNNSIEISSQENQKDEIPSKTDLDDQMTKVEKKLNSLIFSPTLSQKNVGGSALSTGRGDTEKITLPTNLMATLDLETRNETLLESNGLERFAQTYYTTNERSQSESQNDFAKSPQMNQTQNSSGFKKNTPTARSSFIHSRSASNGMTEVKRQSGLKNNLMTRAQRRLISTENTPIHRSSLLKAPVEVRKKSLGTLSEEVSQMVKLMTSKSPQNQEIRRLSNVFSPKSTRFSIEKRNIFLTHLGSQQDTIKQFIRTMKQAESVYKDEKQQLMDQLLEVKQQYKSTQEKYEDPKITSIREVEQNVEHKFKNFLRRNYKPKTLQIANY